MTVDKSTNVTESVEEGTTTSSYESSDSNRKFYYIFGAIAGAIVLFAVVSVIYSETEGAPEETRAIKVPEPPLNYSKCKVKRCGERVNLPVPRIIKGKNATKGQFPFQAVFWDTVSGGVFCGGSMIDDYWIVTSAHCFKERDDYRKRARVSVGVINISELKSNAIKIEQVYKDPRGLLMNTMFDFAMVKTRTRIRTNMTIPICLPYPEYLPQPETAETIISGFGKTDESDNVTSTTLQYTEVSMYQFEKCTSIISQYDWINSTFLLCAGDTKTGKDACGGDSGGPMFFKNAAGKYVLKGMVDSGNGCGRTDIGSLYVKEKLQCHMHRVQGCHECDCD